MMDQIDVITFTTDHLPRGSLAREEQRKMEEREREQVQERQRMWEIGCAEQTKMLKKKHEEHQTKVCRYV